MSRFTQSDVDHYDEMHTHRCWSCNKQIVYPVENCLHSLWTDSQNHEYTVKDCADCSKKHTAHMDPRLNVLTHIDEDFSEDEAWLVLFPNEAPKWFEKRLIGW